MNKILLDTNIMIYSIDEESKYFTKAQTLISNPNFEFYITSKNLSEFLSVVTRFPQNSLNIDAALSIIQDFQEFTTILYPTKRAFAVFQELLYKYKPTGLKIHDYEIVSIALANQVKIIATFNVKDVKNIQEISLYKF